MELISSLVQEHVDKLQINEIITFDEYGISGHPNHIATYNGVKLFLRNRPNIQGFKLLSTNIVRKYSGIADVPFSYCTATKVYLSMALDKNLSAMKAHYSQFVWFRRLFVFFSRYSFVNTLDAIEQ